MKKILFLVTILFSVIYLFSPYNNDKNKHIKYLDKHPYSSSHLHLLDQKKENSLKLPPNYYYENEYLMEMNPKTGKVDIDKLLDLQSKLNEMNRSVPGSNSNNWIERGPDNVPGRTRAIMYDPNDPNHKRVFAGGVSGGLWVINNIEDENAVWQHIGIPENLAVSCITVDVNDSNTFYVGTGESYAGGGTVNGNGIWKSTDGGVTWNHIFGGSTGQTISISNANLVVNNPVGISGTYSAVQNTNFGPTLTSISGDLVLVDSGGSNSTEGCSSILNSLTGKIAVIDRGTCNFTDKVKNAQLAGAIAAIVVNSVSTFPFNMGGADASITIPSVMIGKSDGQIIKNALNSGVVNVTLNPVVTDLPVGLTLVPGKFYINNIITRNNSGTEIYASIAEAGYTGGGLLGGEAGLYKSLDGGASWSLVNMPLMADGHRFTPNDLLVSSDNKLWVSTTNSYSFGGGGGTIFSSNDGINFTQKFSLAGAGRTELAVSSTNPNKFYVLIATETVKLIKTTDGFATTTDLTLPNDAGASVPSTDYTRGQSGYSVMIAVDPNNDEIVYTGGIDTFRSANGGTNWNQISKWTSGNGQPYYLPYVHADIHNMIFDPLDSNKAIISTDGGVFHANSLSTAGIFSTAISKRSTNYNTAQFYKGAISQNINQLKILGGSQDNGSNFISDANSSISSSEVFGGDGMFCFIDKDNQYMVVSTPRNSYYRLNLNGNITNVIVSDGTTGSFVNIAELDDNLDILYTNSSTSSTFGISKFSGLNTTNSPIRTNFSDPMLTATVTAMKTSPYTVNSTTLFLGTSTGSIIKLTNANTLSPVWEDLTPEPYDAAFLGSISAINFGSSEDEIIVTFHNYGVVNVYFTEDGGQTWQNKEGDLPDLPVKDVLMNPLLNDEVILATDLGVWKTNNFYDANPHWSRSYDGMQNVKVTSFDLRTADNTILATTYGRGFFTGQFTSQSTVSVDDNVVSNKTKIFPTISNGNIQIETFVPNIKMNVFDVNGKLVFSKDKINDGDRSILNLEKGIYFVNLLGYNLKESHKIIIK